MQTSVADGDEAKQGNHVMGVDVETGSKSCNGDFPWDKFDTEAYLAHNYEHVREDDREILSAVGDFFELTCGDRTDLRGIDVGTGANLYPTLAMLPFCDEITLFEYSKSNVDWLDHQHAHDWPSWTVAWQGFWQVLCTIPGSKSYHRATVPDMGKLLTSRTRVVAGSVFELQPRQRYDIGTMFFVAESITREQDEYTSAVDHFLNALQCDAPFAIALMEHSEGYRVGDKRFPATDISVEDVREFLQSRTKTEGLMVKKFGPGTDPVRDGYTGMIIAYGRALG